MRLKGFQEFLTNTLLGELESDEIQEQVKDVSVLKDLYLTNDDGLVVKMENGDKFLIRIQKG